MRWHYLIDRDFQFKYAFLLASVALIVSALIGGLIFYGLKESQHILESTGLSTHPQVMSLMVQWKSFIQYNLVMILCGTIFFLGVMGIFITHKMVGPIFVLKRDLQKLGQGKLGFTMNLRKRDEFQDMKACFNETIQALRTQTTHEIKQIEMAMSHLDTHSPSFSLLQTLLQNKKTSLTSS